MHSSEALLAANLMEAGMAQPNPMAAAPVELKTRDNEMRRILLFFIASTLSFRILAFAQDANGSPASEAPTELAPADDADALAKALSNPVATLVSVPFQYNYDQSYGTDGGRNTLNIQPVIPISRSEDGSLISRTIVPIVQQDDVIPGSSQFGLGDVVQSLFFSLRAATTPGSSLRPLADIPEEVDLHGSKV